MSKLYNPIAIYNFNNKKYFIALDDNKIVYFKYENGEVSNDYSVEELEVFLEVYNSIKIDKDSALNLGIKNIGGKAFETFYDIKKELYFWYEIVNGNRQNVSKSDLEYLNYTYNNLSLKYADDNDKNQNDIYDWAADEAFNANNISDGAPIFDWATDPSFARDEKRERIRTFTRTICHKGKTVAIVLVSTISFITLSDTLFHTNIAEQLRGRLGGSTIAGDVVYEEIEDQEYNFDIVADAIDSNENLGSDEKEFFKKFKSYFDQTNQYMDLKTILDRLRNLKIVYTTDECKTPQIAGEYGTVDNVITIYSTDSFANCDKSTLAHEFLHVTQKGYSKRMMMELSNEAATREYIRELVETGELKEEEFKNDYDVPLYGNGYDQCMKVYYLIANLLDQETIGKYQAVPADTVIAEGLVKLEKDAKVINLMPFDRYEMEKRSIALLDAIDELRSAPDAYGYRSVDYSDEKYKKICDMLDYYYQIKFGKKIEECFVEDIMSYDNTYGQISTTSAKGRAMWDVMLGELEDKVENLDPNYRIPMGEYRYVLPKSYFTDRHDNPIVYFNTYEKVSTDSFSGFFVDIEITPEINEKYNEKYKKAKLEISNNIDGFNKQDSTDNIGGMGSREAERD